MYAMSNPLGPYRTGRPTGRPTLFSAARARTVVKFIKEGNHPKVAAKAARVSLSTISNWLQKGQIEESGQFREFFEDYTAAQFEGHAKLVSLQYQGALEDPKQRQWMLERRWPKQWAERKETKATISGSIDLKAIPDMTDQEAAKLIRRLHAELSEPDPILLPEHEEES